MFPMTLRHLEIDNKKERKLKNTDASLGTKLKGGISSCSEYCCKPQGNTQLPSEKQLEKRDMESRVSARG